MCMKKFDADVFFVNYRVFNLAIFQQLHLVNKGW